MTQLVELQQVLPALAEANVALFSISYDSTDVLAEFGTREGITFPMLSDEGSIVITELGLLNEQVHEQHAVFGFKANPRNEGVPYPGVFVLDETGTVAGRRFYDLYRERETGPGLLRETVGIDLDIDGPSSIGLAGAATVDVRLDSADYKSHQRISLHVDVGLEPGSHVFAAPAPEPYRALSVEIDPVEGLFVDEAEWPEGLPFRLEGATEDLSVYEGTVRGTVPLRFFVPSGHGELTVSGRVNLQVCTETTCDMPGSVEFSLPVKEGRFVRPVSRS